MSGTAVRIRYDAPIFMVHETKTQAIGIVLPVLNFSKNNAEYAKFMTR